MIVEGRDLGGALELRAQAAVVGSGASARMISTDLSATWYSCIGVVGGRSMGNRFGGISAIGTSSTASEIR